MVDDKKSEELGAGEKMPSSLSTEGSTTTEEHIKDGGEEFEKDWKKVTLIMMSLYLTMFLVALVSLPLEDPTQLDHAANIPHHRTD